MYSLLNVWNPTEKEQCATPFYSLVITKRHSAFHRFHGRWRCFKPTASFWPYEDIFWDKMTTLVFIFTAGKEDKLLRSRDKLDLLSFFNSAVLKIAKYACFFSSHMCKEVFPSLQLIPTPIYHAYSCEREKISLHCQKKMQIYTRLTFIYYTLLRKVVRSPSYYCYKACCFSIACMLF